MNSTKKNKITVGSLCCDLIKVSCHVTSCSFTLIFIHPVTYNRNAVSSCNFNVWFGIVAMGGGPKPNTNNDASGLCI